MYRPYTGIGARKTPMDIRRRMTSIAADLERLGYTLRSGGADGADGAFEAGIRDDVMKEIYLPWPCFNNRKLGTDYCTVSNDALVMAEQYHPAWHKCSQGARKLHARNCYQVLGLMLDKPSEFVLCWTPGGEGLGGTGQALRIARAHNIPIIDFGHPEGFERFVSEFGG